MRKVILHYHLFKNAGTSLDAAFKENFSEEKGEWVTKEFPNQPAANREQVRQWILDNPQAKCFSSHTALLPVPSIKGVEVFPVVFVRHPIDRIASAYNFEKKQQAKSFGSVLAKNTDMKGYIETRLAIKNDFQCRNFHTAFFNNGVEGSLSTLPFIGLVERYSNCLSELERKLSHFFDEKIKLYTHKKNTTREKVDLEEKLNTIETLVGKEFYRQLIEANEEDLTLYGEVLSRWNR